MINKTFNSDSTDGRALEVGRNGESPWLNIREFDLENTMFMLAPSDAPALALAVLEAAGVPMQGNFDRHRPGTSEHLSFIAQHLERYVVESEHIAAEARERAELETEALNLYKAAHDALGLTKFTAFHMLTESQKVQWLAVARRARELAKEAAK